MPMLRRSSPARRGPRRSRSRSRSPFHGRRPRADRQRSYSPVSRNRRHRSSSPTQQGKFRKKEEERRPRGSFTGRRQDSGLRSRQYSPPRQSRSPRRGFGDTVQARHNEMRYRSPRREGFQDEQEALSSPDQFTADMSDTLQGHSPDRRVIPPLSETSPYLDRNIQPHRQAGTRQFYPEERPPVELSRSGSSLQQSPVFPAGRIILGGNQTSGQYGSSGMLKVVSTSAGRKRTLNERFRMEDQVGKPTFKFEDNITIGIHRHPDASSVSPGPINRTFDPFSSPVHIARRREEGKKAIFDREEIKQFQHDAKLDEFSGYEERRVIAVIPAENQHRMDDRSLFHVQDNFSGEGRQDHRKYDSEHSGTRRHSKERRDSQQTQRWQEQQVRVVAKPDPRYEPLYKEEKEREELIETRDRERMQRVQHNPNDLRHNLLKQRPSERHRSNSPDMEYVRPVERHRPNSPDARYSRHRASSPDIKRHRQNSPDTRRKFDRRHDEDRRSVQQRGRPAESRLAMGRRPDSSVSRSIDEHKRERRRNSSDQTELPDFSRRQDKYNYEDWKENPELIPKNPSYFEHDNRDDSLDGVGPSRFRRGGFRGRPDFRGRFIGRGGFRGRMSSTRFRGRGRGFGFSRDRDFRDTRDSRNMRDSRDSRDSREGRDSRDTRGPRIRERNKDEWKHDMFEEIEKEDDNKPTSTT
ncbi:hypothetical protein ScPMuIL_007916 [Solemya velum]